MKFEGAIDYIYEHLNLQNDGSGTAYSNLIDSRELLEKTKSAEDKKV